MFPARRRGMVHMSATIHTMAMRKRVLLHALPQGLQLVNLLVLAAAAVASFASWSMAAPFWMSLAHV